MGSELQSKYQRLAQEYAKLRSHVDILKKAVKEEKSQREKLEESLREKTLVLRKHVQETESLDFRNQQLTKRVVMLQDDLDSPTRAKKRKGVSDGAPSSGDGVQAQELAAKIAENAELHMKIVELTHKFEWKEASLQSSVTKLEKEASSHSVALEQLQNGNEAKLESITSERAMLEAKLAKYNSELTTLKKALQRERELNSRLQESAPTGGVCVDKRMTAGIALPAQYTSLNVPIVDAKLQGRVLHSLRASLELVTSFTTQLSTLHSYLEQRCKSYPNDTATGSHMSAVNEKLCQLLHISSSYTKPLLSTLSQYHDKLQANPYSQTSGSDLDGFITAHHRVVAYLETLTPYLQLSVQEECSQSVCGAHLTDTNMHFSSALPGLVAAFSTTDDYLSILARGLVTGVPVSNLPVCFQKLELSFGDVHSVFEVLTGLYSSKITFEYQLPTTSQRLNTTNECILSSFTGLSQTTLQLCELLREHEEVFSSALEQSTPAPAGLKSSSSTLVQRLRQRATAYVKLLNKDCPETVPYTLAVYNARCMTSSSENKETLSKQVTRSQEKIARLEQEKEHLVLDLQLLSIKHEKVQKKVANLEAELSHVQGHAPSPSQVRSLNTSRNSLVSSLQPPSLSGSVGSLSAQTEEESSDEAVREELIRKHFTARISELNAKFQEIDSKAAHYYAECRALLKQMNHNSSVRSKLNQDLEIVRETNQQLQDQLATTSNSYEKQLSAMSDHLCELNEKMLQQSEELDTLRKTKGKRWGKQA